MNARILILEDQMVAALHMKLSLEQEGYTVVGTVGTGPSAIAIAEETGFDLMIVDYCLDGPLHGEEAARAVRDRLGRPIPIIFVSAWTKKEIIKSSPLEPCAFIQKPYQIAKLIETIRSFLPA